MTKAKLRAEKRGPFALRPHKRDGVLTGKWLVDIPPHLSVSGGRERKTYVTKTAAISAADTMYRDLQMTGAIRGDANVKLTGVTFAALAERWLLNQQDQVATGWKRTSSLETNAYQLKALGKRFASYDVSRIVAADIENYQRLRLKEGRKAPTINSEVATLIQVLAWAKKLKFIADVPEHKSLPVPRSRPHIPTPEEVERIIGHLQPRTALLARFLAETGCRRNEAFSLEWPDIDFEGATVTIQRKAHFVPKTDHSERMIPISLSLRDQLREAMADDLRSKNDVGQSSNFVFPGRFGGKRTAMRRSLSSAVKKANIRRGDSLIRVTPHVLRKAMATWLHAAQVSDRLLQDRLGHAPGSRVTNRVYVQVPSEEQRKIVFELSALSRRKNEEDIAI